MATYHVKARNKDYRDRMRVAKKIDTIVTKMLDLHNREWKHILPGEIDHLDNMRAILCNMSKARQGGK